MHEHQQEERHELLCEAAPENRRGADEVGEREEFFRREFPVSPLVAEKHPDDRGDGKRVEDERLLPRRETKARQIAENERSQAPQMKNSAPS